MKYSSFNALFMKKYFQLKLQSENSKNLKVNFIQRNRKINCSTYNSLCSMYITIFIKIRFNKYLQKILFTNIYKYLFTKIHFLISIIF